MAGRVVIDVVLNNRQAIRQMESTMSRMTLGARSTAGRLGTELGGAGVKTFTTDVVNAGEQFDGVLGQIREVSGATASEMESVSAQARELGAEMETSGETASSAISAIGGAVAGLAGGAGVAAFAAQVVSAGVEFDTVLNQIRGVSGATEAEMAQVSDKARELGNDITITGASASGAVSAMLELSKGGLSVKDSMDASRGSLLLAAAAQVDAATAAEIQATAINTFSLKASDATHVADVLANTANAAAGDVTDIAYAMQASGSVAAQFKMSIDETAGAIGLLANNGIKGSDAGTLLKSTLLALQSDSKPAVAAMKTLGIEVYDAQGKFVGLDTIMDRLGQASKTLTEEQYNQATSTLFGSDAMRLAGVAAKDGAKSYLEMVEAVGKAGGAAKLGEEQTKGLPGALNAVENASESVKLALYDLVRGPLTELVSFSADGLTGLATLLSGDTSGLGDRWRPIVESMKDAGESLQEIGRKATDAGGALNMLGEAGQEGGSLALTALGPIASVVSGIAGAFAAIPGPVQTTALALGALALARSKLSTAMANQTRIAAMSNDQMTRGQRVMQGFRTATLGPINAMRQFNGEMRVQQRLALGFGQNLTRLQSAQVAYQTSNLRSVSAMRSFTNQVGAVRAGAVAAGTPISRLGATMQTMAERGGAMGQIGTSFHSAAAGAGRFGTVARTAAAGATALKLGATGLMSAMGGPFGLAIGAAVLGLSMYSQRQQEAAQRAAEHKAQVDALVGSIDAQTGSLTRAGVEQMAADLRSGKYGSGNTFEYADKLDIDAGEGDRGGVAAEGRPGRSERHPRRGGEEVSRSVGSVEQGRRGSAGRRCRRGQDDRRAAR
ncbi:MAG: phage tail tape measure protein [Gordonia sp. (in: high G+C Gram-positive bacteria)]|uniref:phage tail tape measure protein n=1 Tax=Gordonia sp. (in: high G+C Gram-positive bacteria) TaxID=84139 RepID=UPI0039E2F618